MHTTPEFATYPSLRGKVVLVTGGASGIGAAIVTAFAQQGARVAFLDVQDEIATALVSALAERGVPGVSFYRCDLTDTRAMQATVTHVASTLGRIDVLVNNAGNDQRHRMEDVTPEFWDQAMAINLKQQFFVAQAVLPMMREAGAGTIINMSSIAWMIPSVGLPVYVAAKAAIVGMTRTLAHEVGADGVRVNCVLPGAILTERQRRLWMTAEYTEEVLSRQAIKRLLAPEEVARLVLFLAAEDSAAITSQSYIIDGGWV